MNPDPPVSASQVLGLQVCATTHHTRQHDAFYLFIYLIFLRYRGLNTGVFYLHATPPALFFILYFETGSHEVVQGLTRQRERDRERERERKS